jgi:Ras GTPase-activating-like protein IQGAP2/3
MSQGTTLITLTQKRFPSMSEENAIKVVANFIYYRYLNSAIKAPESWGVVETVPNAQQRKNLGMVSKMLTHIAGGKVFGDEDQILQSLNDYVVHESQRMIAVFKKGSSMGYWAYVVIEIPEPEEHFTIDPFDDLASTQKPTLAIRQSDVKFVHALVSKELETMAPHVPDVLRDIVTQLGSLHMTDEDVSSSSKAEITLTLEPRFSPMEGTCVMNLLI